MGIILNMHATRAFVAAALLVLCAHASALAQTAPAGATRPYRALFGGSTANPDVHHSFDLTLSLSGGYDDNVLPASAVGPAASTLLQGGVSSAYAVSLGYGWRSQHVEVGAHAGSRWQYFRDVGELIGVDHFVGAGVGADLGRRVRVFANQSVSYAPGYLYALSPSIDGSLPGAVTGGGAFPLGDESILIYDTSASLRYSVTRRGSLEAVGSYRFSDLSSLQGGSLPNSRSQSFGGRYRYSLGRYASLRLGYIYRDGQYYARGSSARAGVHDIDVGVDYRRALSLTRRTSLDFGTGSTIVTLPPNTTESGSSDVQYRLTGEAGLTHEMGRTWRARLAYTRGVGFSEAFSGPIFSDAVGFSLTGFLARRVDASANVGVSVGEAGVGSRQSSFRTWNVTSRVRYALSSMWAVYAEALYYSQDLGDSDLLLGYVPSVLDRKSVQAGLTLWVPLLRR